MLKILDVDIKQNEDGMLCLNDLHKASGHERKNEPNLWLENKKTQELIDVISNTGIPVIKKTAGRYGGTYVCKEMVYAYAMWVSPKFHLKVIQVFDNYVKLQSNLSHLVEDMRRSGESMRIKMDTSTTLLNEIKNHGSAWGAYGSSIRKAKKEIMIECKKIAQQAQQQLEFLES